MAKVLAGEGIVIIIDIGPLVRSSLETTFFSQAQTCLVNILQRKIFADKCRDMVGIVLLGTDETRNRLAKNGQYQHITVLQEPCLVDWKLIEDVRNLPRGNSTGDWVDALVLSLDLLHDQDDLKYSTKKIVLMTDFASEFSDDQIDSIISGLKSLKVELSIIGPEIASEFEGTTNGCEDEDDFNVPSTSAFKRNDNRTSPLNWNGKPKSRVQLAGEALIARVVSDVDGIICSFDEAIPQLIYFQKAVSGSSPWYAMLDIGSNLIIPVTGRIKVRQTTAPTWKTAYSHDETVAIISETSYHLNDDAQTVVDERDIVSGYKYGTTLIPFSDEDAQMNYVNPVTSASLSLLGFTRSSSVPPNFLAGDQVLVITARDNDEAGAVALSSFIQGMAELNMVAISRQTYRKNLNPNLGVLIPDITEEYECLVWLPLPYQEDIRNFLLPSLNNVKDKLRDEEIAAIDQFIDAMNLQEDEENEELEPTTVLNPQMQHFFNGLTQRALNPGEPLSSPAQHIIDILMPSVSHINAAKKAANKIAELFPIKEVEKKNKRKNIFEDSVTESKKTREGSDTGEETLTRSDIAAPLVTTVTTANPAEEFMAALRGEVPNFSRICQQMGDALLQLCDHLQGTSEDESIISKLSKGLKTFREEVKIIDPTPYNSVLRQMKEAVVARSLTVFWNIIKQESLGLIMESETLKSSISVSEANLFLELESSIADGGAQQNQDDYDDLLDDL